MARRELVSLMLLAALALTPAPAWAVVHAGDVAPDFHKTDLNGLSQTLSQYRGRVVVMFLLGYD
jgi:hypothetical protein